MNQYNNLNLILTHRGNFFLKKMDYLCYTSMLGHVMEKKKG